MNQWTLRMATTSYTVAVEPGGRWAELVAWGPHGVEQGPSAYANLGDIHFITEADAAPVEYAPRGRRPFTGADLEVDGDSWPTFEEASEADGVLRLAFTDEVAGLRTVLCYRPEPGVDVLARWAEVTNTRGEPVRLTRIGSAGVCLPVRRPTLSFLHGEWSREFQLDHVTLPAGGFRIGSSYGVPGHNYAPWLSVDDTWGVSLAWSGSWEITAEVEPSGLTRVRAGVLGPVDLAPGETFTTPELALACSDDLPRVWHAYDRSRSRPARKPVLYNSWEATGFEVDLEEQRDLARIAADLGAELFVVDDGWFTGRHDDTGGLGDWYPESPDFGAFVDDVRALGLEFGLWVEPEAVSPKSQLYADHPDWVYRLPGREPTLIRNQMLLNLGLPEVYEFVVSTLDRLLTECGISYLKWDMNRPATERAPELDNAHVRNYWRVLDHLRSKHPHVLVEGCAGGGGRTDLATTGRVDVVWPSDNTAPLDRLKIQHGFLHMHAPHLMSSWVTDAPGVFDTRPRSLKFRFVLAMAGVLGIGADVREWSPEERAEAAGLIARYKEIRDVVHGGEAHLLGEGAIQYCGEDRVVVLAWHTGSLTGVPLVPGQSSRVRLRGLTALSYADDDGQVYSAAHLTHVGLPFGWTATNDADVVVLTPVR
ncbi:alpha-galactosidase [Lentzea sp. HUAS12]|uniref:alpha-galactosidase n=1 Tax=Lentzea sp. HUAS12 TaxID=2951806 RepID=UPI00209D1670|nr:alpha-galactosidase [Lentzea sp. HUAS12]USX55238.1 alpha-galactosidase [Lentzea sp. HUAS12]